MLNVFIIGAGNIVNSRHLPVLLSKRHKYNILGICDRHLEKAKLTAQKYKINYYCKFVSVKEMSTQLEFINSSVVIVATPPKSHAVIVKELLKFNKDILCEKPFVTKLKDGEDIIELAKRKNKIVVINQNFQYSRAFKKLEKLLDNDDIGSIESGYLVQFSNKERRLPAWGDDLPLGLFYDESPHFMYLIHKFFGTNLTIDYSSVEKSLIDKNTPKILSVNLHANKTPISIYCNFESPICEWYFTIIGSKKIAIVDFFRDILIVLPSDKQHLIIEVTRTSALATVQHWSQTFLNGFSYLTGKLFWGIDDVYDLAYLAYTSRNESVLKGISAKDGLRVNVAQHMIVKRLRLIK